jgi:Transposase DDE domain group 1
MGKALINLYCASYARVPKRIVLDFDDTFDAVHGGQQLRLFNAHYDEYGFQPIVVFNGDGRFVTAMLRPAKRPTGVEIHKLLQRLLRAIRANWPAAHILIRADSHYCCPEVIDFCRANGLDFILGVAPTTTLRRMSKRSRRAPKAVSRPGRRRPKCAGSRSLTTAPQVGAASNVLLHASKRAKRGPMRGSSSLISQAADRRRSTRTFIAGAAARKITSNPGRPISHNIAITTRLVDTTERRKLFLLLS